MIQEREYDRLRDEIQRLRDEQQRLRDEQEKLRRNGHSQDGHDSGDKSADKNKGEKSSSQGVGDNDGEKKDGEQGQQQKDAGGQKEGGEKKEGSEKNENEEQKEKAEQPKPPLKQRVQTYVHEHPKPVLLGVIGFIVAVILLVILVIYLQSYEATDDAQIDGHLNAVGARIGGTITGVYADNNQTVAAGQVLVDLDPNDYRVVLEQARATYAQAEAQLRAENPNLPIVRTSNTSAISTSNADIAVSEAAVIAAEQDYQAKLANVRQAEANNVKAQTDVQRYRLLVQREEISHEQYDTIVATAKSQAAGLEAAQSAAQASQKMIDQARAQLQQAQSKATEVAQNAPRSVAVRQAELAGREAALLAAKAQLDQATLNLSYTRIVAPVAGVVGEKAAEVGQRIQAGEQLFVVSQNDVWITANFKETQLRKMHPGQPVDIKVDAYGLKLHGHVESMPGATGSVASLLPPENATGNFIKVVQRLPVRIRLNDGEDPDHRLHPGMSVEPKVWLR